MSGVAEERVVVPIGRRPSWADGLLVGLVAAIVSSLLLIVAGALSGRGLHILGDAGLTALPSAFRAATGLSSSLSYLLSHTLLYLLAGVVALKLAGLADRTPPLVTGFVLVVIIIEFGFLVLTTEGRATGRLDVFAWISLLVAHAVGDVVFALGIVRAHPSLRQALVRGYEW
jgi:hypothetical protein